MRLHLIWILLLITTNGMTATLGRALQSLGQPTMAGNAETVKDFQFRFGNTVFTITGEVEGVLGAESTVGFAFTGKGTAGVTIAPGPFHQANLTTIRDDASGKAVVNGVFERDFEGGVFFTNRVPEALFQGEHVTSSRLASIVDRSVKRWGRTRYEGIDHMLAPFVFDTMDRPVVIAVLWKGANDAVFIYDPVNSHQELYGRLRI